MLTVADLLKVLNRIPAWGRIVTLPDKVEALERRLASLERKTYKGDAKSAELCPKCSQYTFELKSRNPHPIYGKIGVQEEHYKCSECGFSRTRHGN
ncbi:MAG: hypothetical protein BMS9Abin33_0072 [Gammaproteobacteria bacterium]|nr:MAG: hypothetical protein BMS9Abin33_0072 [Gammaproteobacteria bacterium]